MKSKYITHVILEGVDGVGKDTIASKLWRAWNFKLRTYVRGEISDYVYAKKFNRPFISTQRGLPFLYVLLLASENDLKDRIINRSIVANLSPKETAEEILKIQDQRLFTDAAHELHNDYHIIEYCTTGKTITKICEDIIELVWNYIHSLPCDKEINNFNEMYKKGCDKVGIELKVKGNQPFFNDNMIMADAQLHNGAYETFTDKTIPHNLIFSLAYTYKNYFNEVNKEFDICYPINSKILVRKEVYDYIEKIRHSGLTFLTTDSEYIPKYKCIHRMPKVFGDEYIKEIAKAKATIYTARDLAALEMITVRPYEATLAGQVIFVDKLSDKKCKLLSQIYPSDSETDRLCRRLLQCTPEDIVEKYQTVMKNEQLVKYILHKQIYWYETLRESVMNKEEE